MVAEVVTTRGELPQDDAFLLALFEETFGTLSLPLPADARRVLLRQQVAGRTLSYRAAFPGATYAVIEGDRGPVGRIVTWRGRPRELTVVDLAIRDRDRGQGIGTFVMAMVLDQARADDRDVCLRVQATNVGAQRFYRRLGFRERERTAIDLVMTWSARL